MRPGAPGLFALPAPSSVPGIRTAAPHRVCSADTNSRVATAGSRVHRTRESVPSARLSRHWCYTVASNNAHALATAVTRSGVDPGTAAQPPFSTKSPCDHESTFLSAARLADTSAVC